MSGIIVALMQLSGTAMFIGGGIYLLDGLQHGSAAERVPSAVAAIVGVLLLFAVAEIVKILSDSRAAAERSAIALERLAERRTSVQSKQHIPQ